MSNKSSMPDDWDDHDGWESYYRALPLDEFRFESATASFGSMSLDRLGTIIGDFRSRNWMDVWFPGCGFSPGPRAFASLGINVYATDVAPSAIAYQTSNSSRVEKLLASKNLTSRLDETRGTFKAHVHDLRTSFGSEIVDVILNCKAIQGFSLETMRMALQSHFSALRPGGVAVFDTMNVQGERRDQLEASLVEAGFYVPHYQLNVWYRATLAATGIPYMLVLGSPIIPEREDYPYPHKRGSAEYNRDAAILRSITAEYRTRIESEYQKEFESVDPQRKLAQVIYSSG